MINYRDYQIRAGDRCEELMALKTGAVLLVQPTGTGKTVTVARVIRNRYEAGDGRQMIIAPRREIVFQTADKIAESMIDPGIIMSGFKPHAGRAVQVASVDTLRSWVKRGKIKFEPGTLLVPDESHHAVSPTYEWLIQAALDGGSDVLGPTATPIRADGVGMFPTFQHLVVELTMVDAIRQGWLVKPEYRIPFVPDLTGVKIKGGDFSEEDLDRIMNQKILVGDVVDNWMKHARGRPTLVFAAGVKHSMALADEFNRSGFKFVHIDGETKGGVRDKAIKALLKHEIDGITSCAVFTEGTDIPNISCIVDAAPTKSLGRHIQKNGRGARPMFAPGYPINTAIERLYSIANSEKPNFIILDHAGNFYRNGRIDRNVPWELCAGKEIVEKDREKREKARASFTCKECKRVFSGQMYCPDCGTRIEVKGKMKDYIEAELVSLTQTQLDHIDEVITKVDERNFYLEVLDWVIEHGKKMGFAAQVFKQKFGRWPDDDWAMMDPRSASPETKNYIRHRMIAYAKGRANG